MSALELNETHHITCPYLLLATFVIKRMKREIIGKPVFIKALFKTLSTTTKVCVGTIINVPLETQ